ncbi:hypothetical protein F7725_017421 [Dissostichus mawsoni]|uniref:Uncharacterized protein n=1 Tax=Dissostichus mawsoni TaxID=36200 RepID=A0A7J5Z8N0_DISMA|nr:hypothetical protein F7725_017421 [Dissostichus mawsoni]
MSAFSSLESGCCLRNSGPRRDLICSMLLLIRSLRNFSTRGFLSCRKKKKSLIILFWSLVIVGAMSGSLCCRGLCRENLISAGFIPPIYSPTSPYECVGLGLTALSHRGMKPAEIRFSRQRPLQHRDPDMAPTITAAMTNSQEPHTLTHKLRKPLVEKLRRERINSSIEQIKVPQTQPDSKLEKADILEMTVCVLRRLQQQNQAVDSAAVNKGYSRCVQEVTHFLSKEQGKTQSQRRLLNHVNKMQCSSDKNRERLTSLC